MIRPHVLVGVVTYRLPRRRQCQDWGPYNWQILRFFPQHVLYTILAPILSIFNFQKFGGQFRGENVHTDQFQKDLFQDRNSFKAEFSKNIFSTQAKSIFTLGDDKWKHTDISLLCTNPIYSFGVILFYFRMATLISCQRPEIMRNI